MTIGRINRLITYLDTRYTLISADVEERRRWRKNLERMCNDDLIKADRYAELMGELAQIDDELETLQNEAAFLNEMIETLRAWEI